MPADTESSGHADVQYVITLVHGTWAKNAPWVGAESTLSKALVERFGERAKVFPFEWSGGNSHIARREASEKLREALESRQENYGGARHYLICHSHGGNIALHALAGSGLQEKIAGVVCLATPFLVARERDLGRSPWKHLAGALVVVMFLTMWMADRVLLPASWFPLGRFAVTALLISVVIGAFAVLVTKWREYAEKLLCDLAIPVVDRDKLFIIRSPADEASAALALCQFISQLSVRLLFLYKRLEGTAHRWAEQRVELLAMAGGGFVAFVVFSIYVASLPWEEGYKSWYHVATVVGAVVSLLISMAAICLLIGWVGPVTVYFRFLASTVVWPVIILLSILLLPFGKEVAMANILLDVTAETTPPGSWMVHMIEPPTGEELGKDIPPLMHSVVYENPRVLKFVCNWISSGNGAVMKGDEVV